ncbi:membrane-bound lytic murein transglycosylase F [Chitiniphilus shinanonensis]|uniref:Membrane-bound lytic murein transglycosylase F n=1 Tax=Chitiniphilus shinanonensis TaxID=553088 RepID=A0ABQ6BWK9_9NEIS|nr:membrane-bound lytic murein transglycosylase MltF [Chitiniphilus shinanonensis]GLS04582.1 membrane-bound lytic murein transglycosylase F [Chitiniphilus shinanonensis]
MKHWLMALCATALVGCSDMPNQQSNRIPPWNESKELVVLVQNSPTTLYVDAEGKYAGLEYDLVKRFADARGLKVRFIVESDYHQLLERLERREAHLAVGVHRDEEHPSLTFSPPYQQVQPVLVHSSRISDERALAMLQDGTGMVKTLPQYLDAMNRYKVAHPAFTWRLVEGEDAEGLMEGVASGEYDFAVLDSNLASVAQNYFPNVAVSTPFATEQALAWAMPKEDTALQGELSGYFTQLAQDGSIKRLIDRYYGHLDRVDPVDALAFLGKRETVLPRYRDWFREAEGKTGIDWRLIAALSYQESHWDPAAVSAYGVRGMMMLTTDTANRLRVNRLDPYQSIQGGARYMQMMLKAIPEEIAEPDRTWLALAAYNVGIGHLSDARVLARRLNKNPDSWADLKTVLPLLRDPKYFSTLRYGYARGGEPVVFVETLRTYYDILARFEEPAQPDLPMLAEDVVIQNPDNLPLRINNRVVPAREPIRQASL